jgi:uncharacterized membrane protein
MTFSQLEHLVKLDITNDNNSQNGQWGFSQVKYLVKMANVIIVKWGILLTYLSYSTSLLPTYLSTY